MTEPEHAPPPPGPWPRRFYLVNLTDGPRMEEVHPSRPPEDGHYVAWSDYPVSRSRPEWQAQEIPTSKEKP